MMQTYYEKVLDRMRRPVLLVAVAIVASLSASGVAMAVTSTKGSDESSEGMVASSSVIKADLPLCRFEASLYGPAPTRGSDQLLDVCLRRGVAQVVGDLRSGSEMFRRINNQRPAGDGPTQFASLSGRDTQAQS
jgi:hypothetical protein